MTIEISPVHEASHDLTRALNQLLPQLSPSCIQLDLDALQQMVASPYSAIFVAKEPGSGQDRIVGMVSLITFPVLTGIRARIEDLVVDKAVRGQGVGKALIHKALSQAHSLHAKSVDLTSRPMRSQANQLYRHMGFFQRDTNVYRYDLAQPPGE